MNKTDVSEHVQQLRLFMEQHGLAAFVIPSTDAHGSEYVPSHWESRKWISGFDGSAGTAVVTMTSAALWTDSRYFIAAEAQLRDTPFQLMKERMAGTPTIAQWLCRNLKEGETVGIDGHVYAASEATALQEELKERGIHLNDRYDPMASIWKDRPAIPAAEISIQPLQYAGESVASKLERLRNRLKDAGCNAMMVSALDEVAWLLNLRGEDVHCNPVFVAYCLIKANETLLFVSKEKITEKVSSLLSSQGIILLPYESVEETLQELRDMRILLPKSTNAAIRNAVSRCEVVSSPSPVAAMKAVKNKTEIEGFYNAMLRDGVAMVKFLRWLKPAVAAGGVTEIEIDRKLTALRAEQPLYKDISFDTIAAYAAHGAIVHYEATPETDCELKPEGLLLLDSGAQYLDGTTDITRTIALGTPTEEEKHVYTLVLKGHIALSRVKFPSGSSGTQLDLAARYAMWQDGYNFGHGTGHGVGSYLNVHEGPHQIRMNYVPAPIVAGMTVTDEPGIYMEGKFGVRIENTLLSVPYKTTEFGEFLGFEPLTLCPYDTTPIDKSMLTSVETQWINDYHAQVCRCLLPLLDDEDDRQWLVDATKPI